MNIAELNTLSSAILSSKAALNDALAAARAAGIRATVQTRQAPGAVPAIAAGMPLAPQFEVEVDVVLPLPLAE